MGEVDLNDDDDSIDQQTWNDDSETNQPMKTHGASDQKQQFFLKK